MPFAHGPLSCFFSVSLIVFLPVLPTGQWFRRRGGIEPAEKWANYVIYDQRKEHILRTGGGDIVENIRVTLRHNSSNENNGPVFVRINVGLQFVFRIYRPNCPRLFLNGNCNNFHNSRTCWANSLQSSQLYESLNIKIVTGVGDTEKVNTFFFYIYYYPWGARKSTFCES